MDDEGDLLPVRRERELLNLIGEAPVLDRRPCFEWFRSLQIDEISEFWLAELTRFFRRYDIDKTYYAMAGVQALGARAEFGALIEGSATDAQLDAVMRSELFGLLLRETIVGKSTFELALTRLRARGELADRRLVRSAHDCAEGGLLVALAEAAIGGPYAAGGVGATVTLDGYAPAVPLEGLLYGEDMGRVVVSCAAERTDALLSLCREHGVPAFEAGRVGSPNGSLELRVGGRLFSWGIGSLRQTYFEAIPRRMRQPDADRSAGA